MTCAAIVWLQERVDDGRVHIHGNIPDGAFDYELCSHLGERGEEYFVRRRRFDRALTVPTGTVETARMSMADAEKVWEGIREGLLR